MEFFFTVLSAASFPGYWGLDLSSAWIEVLNRTLGELPTGITSTTGGNSLEWIGKLAPLLILPAVAGLQLPVPERQYPGGEMEFFSAWFLGC